jgi:hypothetical protein
MRTSAMEQEEKQRRRNAARLWMAVLLFLVSIPAALPDPACLATPPFREEPGNQVNLLRTEPSKDPVKAKAAYNKGVDAWNAGSRAYNAGNVKGADAYYRTAGQHWKKACDMGWADGCRGAYDFRRGQYLRYWGE